MDLSICRSEILQNALSVASRCMDAQGLKFKQAESLSEAKANEPLLSEYLTISNNVIVAASIWMQNYRFFDNDEMGVMARNLAGFIFKQADDCFYDQGDIDNAIALYQLAVGLDPANEKYLCGVIAPCIQGDSLYPEVALPYAITAARLNPERDEVSLIERLILNKRTSYQFKDKQA